MFTRNRYDVEDYNRDLYQTIRPGHFKTNLPRNNCDGCLNPNPAHNASFGASINKQNLMDVDSELMGLTRKNTKCPENKYLPGEANEQFKNSNLNHFGDCPNCVGESTRLSNPGCTLRGTGWNRWEWLCQNPQDRAIIPFNRGLEIGANTNLMARDNHRPCMPEPVKQSLSHPSKRNMENVDPNVVMFYDPLSKYPVYNNVDQYQVATEQNWKNCTQI